MSGIRSYQTHTSCDHCWPLGSIHNAWDNFLLLILGLELHDTQIEFIFFLRYCFILPSCLRESPASQQSVFNIFAVGKPFLIAPINTITMNCVELYSTGCSPANYSPPHADTLCNYSPSLRHAWSCSEFPLSTVILRTMRRWFWSLRVWALFDYVLFIPFLKTSIPTTFKSLCVISGLLVFYILCGSIALHITL